MGLCLYICLRVREEVVIKVLIKVKIAVMLLLVKCFDNKMVKSPGYSSIGMLPCG